MHQPTCVLCGCQEFAFPHQHLLDAMLPGGKKNKGGDAK
jgi:hypothetical protein